MSAYIYARVSTFEQYINGNSIDAQCELCLKHVADQGMTLGTATNCDLPGVFIDGGKSAFKKRLIERPGGKVLLSVLQRGDTLVVTATHRLFRRMSDMVTTMDHWIQQGVAVRFTDYPMLNTDTANGKAMLYIFAVIAQMKSELTSSRVREARQLSKEKPAQEVKIKVQPRQHVISDIIEKNNVGLVLQEMRKEKNTFRFTGKIRAYIRVSTKEQTVEQQRLCILQQLPADMKDAEIEWYSDEGVSAFRRRMEKRPAGGQLLKDLQAGDIIVAWRPDRIFRSLLDMATTTEQIHNKGAFLHTVEGGIRTDTPFGKTMVSLLSLLAEVESQEISRSVKQGIMIALGTNKKTVATFVPKFLKPMTEPSWQKNFYFTQFFTAEDRFLMHVQFSLTQKNFKTMSEAAKVTSNKWLKMKGFPPVLATRRELTTIYLGRLRAMQRVEFSERRDNLMRMLMKRVAKNPQDLLGHPIETKHLTRMAATQEKFLETAKKINGRIRDKKALVKMANTCVSPDASIDLMNRLT